MSTETLQALLATQPPVVYDKLYGGSPFVCKAMLQSLRPLARNYVMRLLFVASSVPLSELSDWNKASASEEHKQAIEELLKVHVLKRELGGGGGEEGVGLNPFFREGLKSALSNPEEPWGGSNGSDAIHVEDLEKASRKRWDALLRVLVGLDSKIPGGASSSVEGFLKKTGLMSDRAPDGSGRRKLSITNMGYDYMLKSYQAQVWIFVLETIKVCPSFEEAVTLLCSLAYCTVGCAYSSQRLTASQQPLLYELSQVGIVTIGGNNSLFYPSHVAVSMLFKAADGTAAAARSSAAAGSVGMQQFALPSQHAQILPPRSLMAGGPGLPAVEGGFGGAQLDELQIIVETNHQVVAYLTNELHLALLKLFVDFHVALPNMAIGRLTRTKAKEAYKIGIRAEQIVQFLCAHAHPRTAAQQPVIPLNVVDQLVLWQSESDRIKDADAVYVDFRQDGFVWTKEKFQEVLGAAKRLGALLWCHEPSMQACFDAELFREQIQPQIEDIKEQ